MASELGNTNNINILTLSNILDLSDLRVTLQYVETDLAPQMELVKILEQNLAKRNNHSEQEEYASCFVND